MPVFASDDADGTSGGSDAAGDGDQNENNGKRNIDGWMD